MRLDGSQLKKPSYWRDRAVERRATYVHLQAYGGDNPPPAVRGLSVAPGPRKGVLGWELPLGPGATTVKGYRIYRGNERVRIGEIRDPGTRFFEVAISSGASPVPENFFVSTVSANNKEGPKRWIQCAALVEAAAPDEPAAPPVVTAPINIRPNKYFDGY